MDHQAKNDPIVADVETANILIAPLQRDDEPAVSSDHEHRCVAAPPVNPPVLQPKEPRGVTGKTKGRTVKATFVCIAIFCFGNLMGYHNLHTWSVLLSSSDTTKATAGNSFVLNEPLLVEEYEAGLEEKKDKLISSSFNQQYDAKVGKLLSHILVVISYWHSPNNIELKYLGHTLGTIREWKLLPEVGNVTVVILTNNAKASEQSIGIHKDNWYTFHEVRADVLSETPHHMPFYHREIVADYIDRNKEGTNMTAAINKDLPPPSSYAFFEADNVLNGNGLLAWAYDTALLLDHGVHDRIRHFWRYEWHTKKGCAAFTGQLKPLSRNDQDRIITIGDKKFVSMTGGGVWAGMYILTARHMLNYYNSGSYWNLPNKYKYARELQLHDVVHGSDIMGRPARNGGDNTLVPLDENTRTVSLVAGVHHQSDKYQGSKKGRRYGYGQLCINDLFTDEVVSSLNLSPGLDLFTDEVVSSQLSS